ncbi:hypothetical protein ACFFMR_21925 [Micromonospora andamanensis]|uniref:Uncharacterized protein n=1 Tax=Micromonospora andamanensis TaxID=1287068 RepID=A0ABQ4HUG2_9ACTN|nr:hypothetical protein [Micromonospora andamanensis]GIJ09298.1 hypothetical protein Van01_25120 [Micromonospora andamanensis]
MTTSPSAKNGYARTRNDPFGSPTGDFNERQLEGWDYGVDARQIRVDTATDESSLLRLVAAWGLAPAQFSYPWDTDDPR